MRRPLCLFCAGALGLELVCAFLPQMGLWLPFAAFFVVGACWFLFGRKTRGYGLCLLLGALAGLVCVTLTTQRLDRLQTRYAGENHVLTAEVESVSASYYPGIVRAILRVETVDGTAPDADFRFECLTLPSCEAGDEISGRFQLEAPGREEYIASYADGVAFRGEYLADFKILGQSGSFRAQTHRLQKRLSEGLQAAIPAFWKDTGGVLAAMVLGDRSILSKELKNAYRTAGLSHILVVSGMHVSILCGGFFRKFPRKNRRAGRKERSHWSWKLEAALRVLLALLLVGLTGFTPSVIRAAVAVWINALGIWMMAPSDPLTSLAAAGLLMTATNSYAACDVGFELSFAAVLGVLAGTAVFQRVRKSWKQLKPQSSAFVRLERRARMTVLEGVCITFCASLATFPVLVLRGMSVSLYSVVSGVVILWLAEPILLFGVVTAVLSLLPWTVPAKLCGFCAAGLTELLDRWVVWVSGWPGAQLWFDTSYAAIVALLVIFIGWVAYQKKILFRVVFPVLLVVVSVAGYAEHVYTKDLTRVEMLGNKNAPVVLITQQETAVVLFRGGVSNQQTAETMLAHRNIRQTAVLVDLRMNPETPCTLDAKQKVLAAPMGEGASQRIRCGENGSIALDVLRTKNGCAVKITAAGQSFVTLSGSVLLDKPLTADYLLASSSRPDSVKYQTLLTLSTKYRWMELPEGTETSGSLVLRPEK